MKRVKVVNNNKKNILAIILATIVVFFVENKFGTNGNTIIFVVMFFALFVFLKGTIDIEYKRKFFISITIAVIFSIIEIICTSINIDYTLNHIFDSNYILHFFGYIIILWSTISFIYSKISNNNKNYIINSKRYQIYKVIFDSKWSFIINTILIFLAWIPYFLRYFPGLLTADSCSQVLQSMGMAELTNHHPIVHTGIIGLFINIGNSIIGNINVGVCLYTLFQMITMTMMFSVVLKYLSKKNIPYNVRIIGLLYYMLYPVNALFSVIMWKDILFSGIIPIYIICNIELLYNKDDFFNNTKRIVHYIIVSLLVMFLRNNGLYVVILILPLILLLMKKHLKKAILIIITIIVSYLIIKSAIFSVFNVKNGSVGEMLSIPLQQIARVKKYHKEELNAETLTQIDSFFLCNNIEEKYNPVLSDPVKAELNNEFFSENKVEFLKLWLKLLKNYIKDYIESFISNSYGYYYPEAKHWVANRTVEDNDLGIIQTPLIKGKIVSKIDSYIEKREIPLVSMLFSIGMAFWIIVISFGYELLTKNYKMIIPYIIILILWLTIVASPVFCEYRYAYPMFTALPMFIGMNFIKNKNQN